MTKASRSERRRPGRFSEIGGWVLVLAGIAVTIVLAPLAFFDRAPLSVEKERPFAQAARDDHRSPVWSLAFSPDRARLAATTVSGDVWVKNLENGERRLFRRRPVEFPQSVTFTPDGKALVLGGAEPEARLFDLRDGTELASLRPAGKNNATQIVFSPGGRYLAAGGFGGTLTLWDWGTRQKLASALVHAGGISAIAFSKDCSRLVTGDSAGVVKIWAVSGMAMLTVFEAHEPGNGLTAVALAPDGDLLATASHRECTVRLWNSCTGQSRGALPTTGPGVRALSFSPDGTLLATARGDGTAALWSIPAARELGTVRANSRGLQTLAFSGDGTMLATGGADGSVRLWNVREVVGGTHR